jgi:hypothetical protein
VTGTTKRAQERNGKRFRRRAGRWLQRYLHGSTAPTLDDAALPISRMLSSARVRVPRSIARREACPWVPLGGHALALRSWGQTARA